MAVDVRPGTQSGNVAPGLTALTLMLAYVRNGLCRTSEGLIIVADALFAVLLLATSLRRLNGGSPIP